MTPDPLIHPDSESLVSSQNLQDLFTELVQRNFQETLRLTDPELILYLADLLTQFHRSDTLFKIRDTRGHRIEDVGEMLIASNPLLDGPSFDWEREVRKHIGDFTLFFAGLFPEALNHWRLRRLRLDVLVDYIATGKESYTIVSAFNQFEYRHDARFFRKMAEEFERCVFGLNLVKQDLARMQQQSYVGARNLLM